MSNNIIIEEKLGNAKSSLVIRRSIAFDLSTRTKGVMLEKLPPELVWLIENYEQVNLFCEGIPYPRNGWRIGMLTSWPYCSVNQYFDGNPNEYSYFEDVWRIVDYDFDGGEIIAIDLHPGPRSGYIGWVTQTDLDYGGGAIVIAKTFFEWLERTLDHGPDAQHPYWREKGFKDYGPLIPDDPYYKPS